MSIKQNHYMILGIAPGASVWEIKEAYRKQAFRYHPDRNKMRQTTNEKMKEINEAYTTLSDPAKRRKYDIPMGYCILVSKFKTGSKVMVSSRSNTPYRNYTGVIDEEPIKDTFRFWYTVKFNSKGLESVARFAEEELSEI